MLGTDSNSNNSPPLSPRQPWGHSGIQKTNFAWKSAFGDFMFDTTDESMEPFNVFHNDRILITKGVWGGRKATVLGVSNGVVWLQIDDEEFVKDLKGCFTGDDLEAKFGLQVLEDDPDDAVWPESPRHPKLTFVAAIDDAHRKAFEYEGPMGTYTFNCTREATERYGFHHGQRVRATKGAYRSRCATVIGVHNGALWVHIDGDNGASPCHFCNDKADLEAKYGYKVITATATPTGMVRPPAYDKVEYPGPFGLKYSFERGEETLKRYSVTHGQTLQIGRGTDNGKKTVVIGVQTGVLWWHIQGDRAATPCQFCENFEDLQERYEVITTHEPVCKAAGWGGGGRTQSTPLDSESQTALSTSSSHNHTHAQLMMVEPNLSVWEGEPTDADQRRRERDEIESENIDDMPWDEVCVCVHRLVVFPHRSFGLFAQHHNHRHTSRRRTGTCGRTPGGGCRRTRRPGRPSCCTT